jgi:hypothetical protein
MANHALGLAVRKKNSNIKEFVQHLEIEVSKNKKIFLSTEILGEYPKKTYDLFKRIDADKKIIIYLRKPDEYLESMYKTYVRSPEHSFSGTFSDFLYGEPINKHHSYVRLDENYFDHLKKWDRYFGTENIIVRPFEKVQLYKNNIIADIIHVMGGDFNPGEIEEVFVNKSVVSNEGLEFYRLINEHYSKKGLKRKIFLPGDRFKSILNSFEGTSNTSLFTDKERKEILAKHEIPCRNVAKKYLNKSDSNLFSTYFKPSEKETFDTLSVDQVITVLIQVVERSNKTKKSKNLLKKKMKKLYSKFIGRPSK